MKDNNFNDKAEQTLQYIADILEESDQNGDIECDLIDGILTLEVQEDKQFIINKHDASKQIWLSSPVSGGSHFSYKEKSNKWVCSSNSNLFEVISKEIDDMSGLKVKF